MGNGTQNRRIEELIWHETQIRSVNHHVASVDLRTNRGNVFACYHPGLGHEPSSSGVIWVGGAGGGLDGPAHGLYPEACRRLQERGIAGLRLDYRFPNYLDECVLDTLLGIEFLKSHDIEHIALAGHSFGGAVVITAAAMSDSVEAVVPMSTQTYGTGLAPKVSPRAMLLIHGTSDEVLPAECSRQVFERAKEPKELKLFVRAGHGLDECREQVLNLLCEWIPEHLGETVAAHR